MSATDPHASPPGLLRRTLVRRRWPIFTRWALLTVALMATAYVQLVGPYRASSFLRVDPASTDLFAAKAGGESTESFIQTQAQLITSPNVLTAAGNHAKMLVLPRVSAAGDVVEELRRSIAVAVIPGTYLIEVSASSSSASEAATRVNAVVESYLEANGGLSDGMTRTQIQNLEGYKIDLKKQADELERRWKELVARGDVDKKARQSNLISPEHGAKLEALLVENDLARLKDQAQLDALNARQVKDPTKLEELGIRVEAANFLERALNARRASSGFDPKNPKTDEIDIQLILEERNSLKTMQDAVARRLEQLRLEATGGAKSGW